MAYLVTGGTGLIGSRIVRDLVRANEDVVVYDWSPDMTIFAPLLSEQDKARLKVVQGDVTDLISLLHTIKENKVEKIIHLASLMGFVSEANPSLAVKVNCEGTVNMLEAARIFGLSKVVWASSLAVFGPPQCYPYEYIPNDAPHYPWGVYGSCKSFNENLAKYYFDQYNIDAVGIRYSAVYGAGQSRGGIASLTRELVMNPALGKPGKVPFGDDSIGWLYVNDAARATVMASTAPKTTTRAFSLVGDIRPIKEAANYVKSLLTEADITVLPGTLGISWKVETECIEKEVGFHLEWRMERGIRDMINMLRTQNGLPQV